MNAKNGANQPLELGPPALSSFAIAVSSISIAQGDFSVLDWENTIVGERHAESVAANRGGRERSGLSRKAPLEFRRKIAVPTVASSAFLLLYISQFDGNSAGRANHVTRRVFIIIFLFNMRVPAVEVAPFSPFSL